MFQHVIEGLAVVGGAVGGLGIGLPFLKEDNTYKAGEVFGFIAKRFLGQKTGAVRRYASTAEKFAEGFLKGLSK